MNSKQTFFVCPAPPCPNGKLHLGHVGGVYLLTDIFVRFQRMIGNDAYHLTGSDEHGTVTFAKGMKLGKPVDQVAQMYNSQILHCMNVLGIIPDEFVRTTSEDHIENSLAIYNELYSNGYINIINSKQLFCEFCDDFAADSFAVGTCSACGSPTDSNLCENCGLAIQHSLLRNPKHTICGRDLILRPIKQAHFDVKKLTPIMIQEIQKSKWPNTIKQKELNWFRSEVRPLPMSRYCNIGISLPNPHEVADQTILTWFEGLWCFDTGIRRHCTKMGLGYSQVMQSQNTKLVFFMGQDNRFYYTVGVSASLLARGYQLPHNHSVQDFHKLEGEKFSTGRNHAVWADECSTDIDQNVLRFYLTTIAKPFGTNNNHFQIEGLIQSAANLQRYELALRKAAARAIETSSSDLSPSLARIVAQFCSAMGDVKFWDAIDSIDAFFSESIEIESSVWSANEISVFLSMMHPITPLLSESYGKCFFGDDWVPLLESTIVALSSNLPPKEITFPVFATPISNSFIKSYESRFRAMPELEIEG